MLTYLVICLLTVSLDCVIRCLLSESCSSVPESCSGFAAACGADTLHRCQGSRCS